MFLENGFVGSEYVEVYAGGASVALSLLLRRTRRASHQRLAVQLSTDPDDVDLAFPTSFLDRTARSGITAAAIGGKDQAGPTKGASQRCLKRAYPSEA